jgi:uncharacterized membrane protein YqiK
MDNLIFIGVAAVASFALLVLLGAIVSRLYKRASKETAFVRTGWGGQKVCKDGGAMIVPVLHDTIDVNMKTLKLDVSRHGQEALMSKDSIRVDVDASFYTRVKPDDAAIAAAAQTLGDKTQNPLMLKEIIENKFVDVLRSVAVQMDLNDLISKRADFSAKVKEAIVHNIEANGLELEDVSVTKLDQTDIKFLNKDNVFDAAGLAAITKITQAKAQERNDVEQTTRIQIEQRNLQANQESLKIKQNDEFAVLEQEREVQTRRAEQEAQLAKQRADRKREADVALIEAERATALAKIDAARLEREADIKAKQELQLAEQAASVAINQKSEEESKARASADSARAEAVKASQEVVTAEVVAKAEREKRVAIIDAEKAAGQKATEITVIAKSEYDAAELRAKARLIAADAEERENTVRASGERALAEAANALSPEQVQMRIRLAAIQAAPQLAAEMAKPMSAVKNARIVAVTGMGNNGSFVGNGSAQSGNVPDQLTDAMLKFRLQAPMMDEIGKMAGMDLSKGLSGINPLSGYDAESDTATEEAVVSESVDEVDINTLKKLSGIPTSK